MNTDHLRVAIEATAAPFEIPAGFEADCDPVAVLDHERRRLEDPDHPIVKAAQAYTGLVRGWFEARSGGLQGRVDGLVSQLRGDDSAGPPSLADLAGVLDALETVRWDRYLIAAKLYRAVRGTPDRDRGEPLTSNSMRNDASGSAKVALLAIDRSEAMWRVIGEWCPLPGSTAPVEARLAALRTMVETEFPEAQLVAQRRSPDDAGSLAPAIGCLDHENARGTKKE